MADAVRELVRRRADGRCEYCRLPDWADEWPFHVDHVVARQHGGPHDEENLCWACSRCNLFKGPNLSSIDPHSGMAIALFNPRIDDWPDHFRVDGGRIVGLTPTGRTTVRLLAMNGSTRMELRQNLIAIGEY